MVTSFSKEAKGSLHVHPWFPFVLPILCLLTLLLLTDCAAAGPSSSLSTQQHILAVGSTALQPLVAAAATLFERQQPQVHIEARGGGSLSGLAALTNKQADIADSDIYADPALYPDPNLTDHLVCVIPFVVVVAPGVSIKSLTIEQLIGIFSTGTIRNWQEVGGPNLPIVPVVRPSSSGTRAVFRTYLLNGRDEHGKLLTTDSSLSVRETVAHTPGAIGYLALPVLDQSVHALAINGLAATQQNIETNRYPFWAYEHMYTLGSGSGPVDNFLNFMLSAAVQQLEQRLGYIPTTNMKLPVSSHVQEQGNVTSTFVFHLSEGAFRERF